MRGTLAAATAPRYVRLVRSGAMIAVALILALDACGGSRSHGPDWPESAGTEIDPDEEDDGGESVAPRLRGAVAEVETAKSPASTTPDAAPGPDALPAATGDAAPASLDAAAATEPPVVEEITIEVKGD
jgi:hypothetical protein